MKSKRLIELEKELIELYYKITSFDNGYFRNIPMGDKSNVWKRLKREFPTYQILMFDYVSETLSYCKDECAQYIPLPPFVVFPMYSPDTMGWRMGYGSDYEELWSEVINSLSMKELNEYCKNFDYPPWWISKDSHTRYINLPWKNM